MKMMPIFALCLALLMGCGGTTPPASTGSRPMSDASSPQAPQPPTIAKQVLIDQEGIRVTVKSLDLEGSDIGPQLKLLIENLSSTPTTVQLNAAAINGLMVDYAFSCEVQPGKKANDEILFLIYSKEEALLKDFATIALSFRIYQGESYETSFDTELITVNTNYADSYTQEFNVPGSVIYEQDGIKIIHQGISSNKSNSFGPELALFIENNTEKNMVILSQDVSVNDYMVATSMACEIYAGCKAYTGVAFLQSDLDDSDIQTIKNVELKFHISEIVSLDHSADADDNSVDTETIVISL